MITIRDHKAKKSIAIEAHQLRQILTAATCQNIDNARKIEKTTFGELIKGYGLHEKSMVETCLMNQMDNWLYCTDQQEQINEIEQAIFGD